MTLQEYREQLARVNAFGRRTAVESFIGAALMLGCGTIGWVEQGSVSALALGCFMGGLMLGVGITLYLIARKP